MMIDKIGSMLSGFINTSEAHRKPKVERPVERVVDEEFNELDRIARNQEATLEKVRKVLKAWSDPDAVLAQKTGVSVATLDAFRSGRATLPHLDARKLVPIILANMHVDARWELRVGPDPLNPEFGNINRIVEVGAPVESAKRVAPEIAPVKATKINKNAPSLSKHEAIEAFNLLRGIYEPVPLRAVRDGLRQRIEWGELTGPHLADRLDMLVQILFENRVLFNAPDKERPNTSLVRVDRDGLDWLHNQASKNY
ncbi:hypothetical protein [Aquibium oceanicum]|uniref:Uncharacterized protein n=1 Tax=Aquibium oceanicum TaxID=1670800 RepID=A0A1L3SP47_9HYPH|nr:hypothetical protein [Aquibium oceanicum]APH71121.1 hypothetical protein BSQ44_06860 [Aquibium oceanicum]